MSRVLLATPSEDFAAWVQQTIADASVARYWRDGILDGGAAGAAAELGQADPSVLVLGPDVELGTALELAQAFDRDHPEVVVLLAAEPSGSLWSQALKAGVRDVIAPGTTDDELRASLSQALATAARHASKLGRVNEPAAPAAGRSSRVITVLSPKGGSGKTTVATNLAVGLAQGAQGGVVVVDLDLQFGDVASALRLTPEHTIADTARSGVFDATTLKVLLAPHPAGLFALCAPESLAQADDVQPDRLGALLEPLAAEFKYIIIDTASGIDPHALAAMELATDHILVCTTDVPCVRGVRKAVEAIDAIGLTQAERHFLLNRADARVGLSASDIESTLGMTIDVSVPSSQAMWLSLNSGTPILESDPGSPAGRAMQDLVGRFAPKASALAGTGSGSLFRRRKAR